MLRRMKPRSGYDVVALIALFVAVAGGGAYAADTIGSEDIVDESILSQDIRNEHVRAGDLDDEAVTTSRIRRNAVRSDRVLDGSLTGADVVESSLATVPDADRLDGKDSSAFLTDGPSARSTRPFAACDALPYPATKCAELKFTQRRPGRALILADGSWYGATEKPASGECLIRVWSTAAAGPVAGEARVPLGESSDSTSAQPNGLSGHWLTPELPAGGYTAYLECKEWGGDVVVGSVEFTAVELGQG